MRVLCVTCIRDEGPYILDWLAHHRTLGITDFLVFSNDCSDGSDQLLDALDARPRGSILCARPPIGWWGSTSTNTS